MNKRKSLEGQYYGTLYEMSCQLFKKVRSCLTLEIFISAVIIVFLIFGFFWFFLGALPALLEK